MFALVLSDVDKDTSDVIGTFRTITEARRALSQEKKALKAKAPRGSKVDTHGPDSWMVSHWGWTYWKKLAVLPCDDWTPA